MASSMSRCDASGSCQPVNNPSTANTPRSGVMTVSVQPSPGCTRPRASATVSSDRTTVVPMATTRPPLRCVSFTRCDVCAGTRKYSAYGASWDSSDDTPVCNTTGAMPTPLATSRVMTSGVNGRPALGISALPGSLAYTFWYMEIGQLPRT